MKTDTIRFETNEEHHSPTINDLSGLSADQLTQVLQALHQVGPFGEVHLVIKKGELKFIRLVTSLPLTPDHIE